MRGPGPLSGQHRTGLLQTGTALLVGTVQPLPQCSGACLQHAGDAQLSNVTFTCLEHPSMSLRMHLPQSSNRSNPHATHTHTHTKRKRKRNHKHTFQHSQLELYMIRTTGTDKRKYKGHQWACGMAAWQPEVIMVRASTRKNVSPSARTAMIASRLTPKLVLHGGTHMHCQHTRLMTAAACIACPCNGVGFTSKGRCRQAPVDSAAQGRQPQRLPGAGMATMRTAATSSSIWSRTTSLAASCSLILCDSSGAPQPVAQSYTIGCGRHPPATQPQQSHPTQYWLRFWPTVPALRSWLALQLARQSLLLVAPLLLLLRCTHARCSATIAQSNTWYTVCEVSHTPAEGSQLQAPYSERQHCCCSQLPCMSCHPLQDNPRHQAALCRWRGCQHVKRVGVAHRTHAALVPALPAPAGSTS